MGYTDARFERRREMQQASLIFLLRGQPGREEVCLSRKKRKFGQGLLAGYGGIPKPDETMPACGKRELLEESGVSIEDDLHEVAVVKIHKCNGDWQLHVYVARRWSPDPKESEEHGPPGWYEVRDLPFTEMFPDCQYWLSDALIMHVHLEVDICFDPIRKKANVVFPSLR